MMISVIKILFLVVVWCVLEGNGNKEPTQNLRSSEDSCPNYFAEFFYQISQRNQRARSKTNFTDLDHQAWLSTSLQILELSELLKGLNKSAINETKPDPTPSPKFKCAANPDALNNTGRVVIVNSTELLRLVSRRPNTSAVENGTVEATANSSGNSSQISENVCAIVMFFAKSCRFSAATAPSYNALGRALGGVDVLAFDIHQSYGVNSRYGIVAVPSIVLFHNGKLAQRFNESKRTLENMLSFIHNLTGLPVNNSVAVSPEDHEGPVPTVAVIGPDYFLWFSNVFLVLCGLSFLQQKVGAAVRARIRAIQEYLVQVWRTGEFYEQVGIADNDQERLINDGAEIR